MIRWVFLSCLIGCSHLSSRPAEFRSPAAAPLPGQATRKIIFGVDGNLIQGIPANKASEYDSAKLIKIGDYRTYRVADHALTVLRRLAARPGVEVSLFSEFNRQQTELLLTALSNLEPKEPPLKSILASVLTSEDLQPARAGDRVEDPYRSEAGRKDLRKFGDNLDQMVLVDNVKNATHGDQRERHYYYGHPAFAFESFEKANSSARDLMSSQRYEGVKIFFPSSEAEWRGHHHRMAALLFVLQAALEFAAKKPDVPFAGLVREVAGANPLDVQIREGLAELTATYAWETSGGRVSGCSLKTKDGRVLQTVEMSFCEAVTPAKLMWQEAPKNLCVLVTPSKDIIREAPVAECFKALGGRALWVNAEHQICGLFTSEFAFMGEGAVQLCDGQSEYHVDRERHVFVRIFKDAKGQTQTQTLADTPASRQEVIKGGCNQEFGPITADDSPNRQKFQSLLKNAGNASLEDLLILWYPDRKGSDENYLQNCLEQAWGRFRSNGSQIIEECRPEILYSWGPPEKVVGISKNAPDGQEWRQVIHTPPRPMGGRSPMLYATVSPVATYPYGLIPIRLKVKEGAQYYLTNGPTTSENEIGYFYWPGHDFYLKNGVSLESWSYGTPEHYDEIVRDIRWIASGRPGIVYYGTPGGSGLQRVTTLAVYDGFQGGEAVLKKSLLRMIEMILNGEGRINYQKGVCRNRAKTFLVKKPSYFAPFKKEASPK